MSVIRLKRRAAGGAAGSPASLATSEPAFNEADNTLYIGAGDDGAGNATSVKAIAGSGAYCDLSSAQTVNGAKTFSAAPTSSVAATATNHLMRKGEVDAGLATKAATVHAHAIADVTNLQASLDAKAATVHAHAIADVTNLQASLDAKAALSSPSFTGAPSAPTAAVGTATTQLATCAFVRSEVDLAKQGLSAKDSVRAATTANITLSGLQTIDGIALAANDRVLVKNQATANQNGIYFASATAWTRTPDFNSASSVANGAYVFVEEGTAQADSGWTLTTDGVIAVGTTALSFTQFSGAGQILAGAGLTKSGNSIDVVGAANRIVVNADNIDIASNYAGQATITTLGAVTAGTWQATAVALAYGGTGANLGALPDGAILLKSGAAVIAATAGTHYLAPSSIIAGGTF